MADKKIELCPYCQGECEASWFDFGEYYVGTLAATMECLGCEYRSKEYGTKAEAIAAHNKVSRNNASANRLLQALGDVISECDMLLGHFDKDRATIERARAEYAKATGESDV